MGLGPIPKRGKTSCRDLIDEQFDKGIFWKTNVCGFQGENRLVKSDVAPEEKRREEKSARHFAAVARSNCQV